MDKFIKIFIKIAGFVLVYIVLFFVLSLLFFNFFSLLTIENPFLQIVTSIFSWLTPVRVWFGGPSIIQVQEYNPLFWVLNIGYSFLVYKLFVKIFIREESRMKKVVYVFLILSVILNLFLAFCVLLSKEKLRLSQIAIEDKTVGEYIYVHQGEAMSRGTGGYTFGRLTTKVIPNFTIPGRLDVIVNEHSLPLDTSQIKDRIPEAAILLEVRALPKRNEFDENTILAYSKKTVKEIIRDEETRTEKSTGSYQKNNLKNGMIILEHIGGYSGDNKPFEELYLIDVEKYNQALPLALKTFLIIPSRFSEDSLDQLKENIKNFSIIELPFIPLPVM